MRRGVAVALGLLAVATPVALWRTLFSSGDPAAVRGPTLRVEHLSPVRGPVGAPRATAAAGAVLAACYDDGSLVVRRGMTVMRVAPPEGGEELRRVAAFPDGRVVAISQRGRLYEVRLGVAEPLSLRAQAGSRMVAQPGSDALWFAGEAGRLRRLDFASRTFTDVGEGGEPPTSALAATASHAVVGGVDGGVRMGTLGGSPGGGPGGALSDVLHLAGDVTAVDAFGPWIAAGDAHGEVRSKRPKTTPSGATARVGGRVVAIALPRPEVERLATDDPLLVVHEPASATLLWSGAFEHSTTVALGGKPLCGCALDSGQGLYVGLETGEEVIVRVEPAR